jgi:CubicO group peptidase (beta-lactamase class C family)
MKYLALTLIILFFFNSCKKDINDLSLEGQIEHLVKSHIVFGRTPGVAIGTFHEGEENHYFFGTRNLSTGEKADEFTMFEIGSITKTFTALLFADLITRDVVSLTDTIDTYFNPGIIIPDKNGVHIQLVNLLNHTSGIPREPDLPDEQSFADFSETDLADYLNTLQLHAVPGEKYEYSNLGMGMAGYSLKKITGESYYELLKEKIFIPFQMRYTACDENDFITGNIARGYYGNTMVGFYRWSVIFAPAGVIKSNLHDMMIYLKENIDYNNSILKDALALTKKRTFMVNEHLYLGLGWHLTIDGNGDEIYWHNGGTRGFSSFIAFNNSSKDGVVVLINSYCYGEQDIIGIETLRLLRKSR